MLPTGRGWTILKPFTRHVDETQRLRAGRPREMGPEYVTTEERVGRNLHQVDGKGGRAGDRLHVWLFLQLAIAVLKRTS
jgi:hypothetical protein